MTQRRPSKIHKTYFAWCNNLHEVSAWVECETCLCDDNHSYAHNCLEAIQYSLCMTNINPYVQIWHMLHRDENTNNSYNQGGELEIIILPTSDQGGLIVGSEVGSKIHMRAKSLEGGCSCYNTWQHTGRTPASLFWFIASTGPRYFREYWITRWVNSASPLTPWTYMVHPLPTQSNTIKISVWISMFRIQEG